MKVLIAGLGLIGGSFALALRDHGIAEEILGVESSEEHAAEALQLGLADRIVSFEEGVPEADLVVLATPVDTIPLMAVKALNRAGGRQVVMDMGSIKGELCEVISNARPPRTLRRRAPDVGYGVQRSESRPAGAFTAGSVVLCDTVRSDKDAVATDDGRRLRPPRGGGTGTRSVPYVRTDRPTTTYATTYRPRPFTVRHLLRSNPTRYRPVSRGFRPVVRNRSTRVTETVTGTGTDPGGPVLRTG